jgi:hypothetical protein
MSGLRLPILGLVIAFFMFLPSFSAFYTNDDFFQLKISQPQNISQFINFFNLKNPGNGYNWYRPLSTQVTYFLNRMIFGLNPLPLRIFVFLLFVLLVFMVYELVKVLTFSGEIAALAAFFYAISVSHFGQLYYFGNQEIISAFFYLASVLLMFQYLQHASRIKYILCAFAFLAALASKEIAVTLPFMYVFLYFFIRLRDKITRPDRVKIISLVPFFVILAGYAYFRFFHYGFPAGDSYIFDFSPRLFNTLSWYGLWSLGIPEMLVDFVGPGMRINPNLFRYWSQETVSVTLVFLALAVQLGYLLFKALKRKPRQSAQYLLFSLVWFVFTLGPVLLLPWHKFSFYLTLPLVGAAAIIAVIIKNSGTGRTARLTLAGTFLLLSVLTLKLTVSTNWITRGLVAAKTTDEYLQKTYPRTGQLQTLVFYDNPEDKQLPWSPAGVLKNVLSDNNYFQVFWPGRLKAIYLTEKPDKIEAGRVYLAARQFLGY